MKSLQSNRGRPRLEKPESQQIAFKVSEDIISALDEYAQKLKTNKGTTRQHISKGLAAKSIILDWYYKRA